jgi:outer membrane immunogenic protein
MIDFARWLDSASGHHHESVILNRKCGWLAAAVVAMSGMARAQSDVPWNGFYAGFNLGQASGHACSTWTPSGESIDNAVIAGFDNQNCSGGDFVFGARFGENFQINRFVWGLDADVGAWRGGTASHSLNYMGGVLPPGTYTFSGRPSPSGYAIVGPRIGYAGNLWMPYVEVGGLFAFGAKDDTLTYTLTSGGKPIASFSGGQNFSTTGWVSGGGFEWGLHGAWTIDVEYLHLDLGKGSDSAAKCAGSVPACGLFSGIGFENTHDSFSGNMIRIGFNYWFNYWDPAPR